MKRWHSRRRLNHHGHCGRKSNIARFIGVTSRTRVSRHFAKSHLCGGKLARLINVHLSRRKLGRMHTRLAIVWAGKGWKRQYERLGRALHLEKRGNLCVTRKHMINISEREQKRVGEKRGCSGGTRIIGFSYFRPWMASRIAELRKWRTQRGDDGGSYQLPRLHLQQTNEHATKWYGDESYSRNSRARESLKSTMLRGIKVWFCTRPIFTPFRRGISILIF